MTTKKEEKPIKKGKTMTGEPANEIEIEPMIEDSDDLTEISIQQRLLRKARMKRMQPRLRVARRRADRRGATLDVVKRRARRRARSQVKKKFSFGRKVTGAADKKRIEMMANKRKALITRLGVRKRVDVRRDASTRRSRREEFEHGINEMQNTSPERMAIPRHGQPDKRELIDLVMRIRRNNMRKTDKMYRQGEIINKVLDTPSSDDSDYET